MKNLEIFKNEIKEVNVKPIDTFEDEIEIAMFLYVCISSKNNEYNFLIMDREEILNTILKLDLNFLTIGEVASFILRTKKYLWRGLDLEEVKKDEEIKDFLIALDDEMEKMEVKERIISRFRLETLKNIMEKLRKAYIIRRTIKALNKKDTILEIEKEIIDINNVVKTKVATSNTDVFFREKTYNFLINNNEKIESKIYTNTVIDMFLKLKKRDLFIISGIPGTGKSSFCLDLALKLESAGNSGIIFSMEMGKEAMSGRTLGMKTAIPIDNWDNKEKFLEFIEKQDKKTQKILWDRIEKSREKTERLEIFTRGGISVDFIEEYVNNTIALGRKLDFITVDYLQLLRGKGKDKTEEITDVSIRLKEIAMNYNIVVIAVAQMTTESKKNFEKGEKLLSGTALKGSSQMSQDASAILFLTKIGDIEDKKRLLNLQVSKQREGETFDNLELEYLLPNQIFLYHRIEEKLNYVKPKEVEVKEVIEQQKMIYKQ